MDALSEVLRLVRLTGAVFLNGEFTAPWAVASPPSHVIARSLLPSAEYVVEYHLVAKGSCFIRVPGGQPVALEEGDLVMLPRGDSHVLSSDAASNMTPLTADDIQLPAYGDIVSHRVGGGGELTRMVCGYLAVDRTLSTSLLSSLPRVLRVSAGSGEVNAWLETYVRFSLLERGEERPGGACVLSKLSELMFVEGIRRYVEALPPGQTGWLAGVRDPLVGKALALMHRSPARPWTVESLGKSVGLSRSSLAERFTELIGQPPMQYLTQWRLTLAAHLLQTTNKGAAVVAEDVGYDSEAAFSRAFRREFGAPPATWRRGVGPRAEAVTDGADASPFQLS
jgi:AraC-like DNA-binding protein/mannose-6-phosphate isomerase-like protein (cupin superfamily)